MYKKALLLIITLLFVCAVRADRILLEDGQILEGTVDNQFGDFISVNTDLGVISVNKDEILSVTKQSERKNIVSKSTAKPQSNIFYRNQIKNLNSLIEIYKDDITHLESEISKIKQQYLEKIEERDNRIRELESELKKTSSNKNRFKELIPIDDKKDLILNLEYIKKVRFHITKDTDGYFIGAEYQVFSDFVDVKPHFQVYFFNKDGLNIGTTVIEWKFSRIPPQKRESIIKGVTMDISGSRPEYFYIKILKDRKND